MRRIIVGKGAQRRDGLVGVVGRLGRHRRDVGVLPLHGDPGVFEDPDLGEIQRPVVVGVTRDIARGRGHGPVVAGDGCGAGIVGDAHTDHRTVARIAHFISPSHRPANRDVGPRRCVGVLPVGELLQRHRRRRRRNEPKVEGVVGEVIADRGWQASGVVFERFVTGGCDERVGGHRRRQSDRAGGPYAVRHRPRRESDGVVVARVVDVGVGVGLQTSWVDQPPRERASGSELARRHDDEVVTVAEEGELVAAVGVGRCRPVRRVDAGSLAGLVEVDDDARRRAKVGCCLVGAIPVEVTKDEVAEVVGRHLDDDVVRPQELAGRQRRSVDRRPVGVPVRGLVVRRLEGKGDLLALTRLAVDVERVTGDELERRDLREGGRAVGRPGWRLRRPGRPPVGGGTPLGGVGVRVVVDGGRGILRVVEGADRGIRVSSGGHGPVLPRDRRGSRQGERSLVVGGRVPLGQRAESIAVPRENVDHRRWVDRECRGEVGIFDGVDLRVVERVEPPVDRLTDLHRAVLLEDDRVVVLPRSQRRDVVVGGEPGKVGHRRAVRG